MTPVLDDCAAFHNRSFIDAAVAADHHIILDDDREGADRTHQDLLLMLDMRRDAREPGAWQPRVFMTQARKDVGLPELLEGIRAHQDYLSRAGGQALAAARRERLRQEFLELLKEGVFAHLVGRLALDGRLESILDDIMARRTDPYSASEAVIRERWGSE